MTFVATVNGPETIWMVADRRLSYKGRPPKDDACKIMVLETTDAIAILGYAGLGATALGTEPADWMSAVLRGRNLPLENSLGVLADAIKRQLPEHIRHLPAPAHTVIATAFLRKEAKLYTIDLVLGPDRDKDAFRYTRHVFDKPASIPPRTPPVATAGSGGLYLSRNPENRRWVRDLLCLVRAHDRGRVSARVVADRLAAINNNVHLRISDKSVGPRCIVAWRYRKGGAHKTGGAHQFYTGTAPDSSSPALPIISNGVDIQALLTWLSPQLWGPLGVEGIEQPSANERDAAFRRLSSPSDEKLR